MVTVLLLVIIIVRCKGCGIWVLTAFWGTLFQLAISPFSWVDAAMEIVRESGPDDGDGGRPGTGGRGGEEKEQECGGTEEEILVVAEWPCEGGAP